MPPHRIASSITASHSALSDADIIQAIQAGQRNGFELLMRRFNRILYRAARAIVKNDAEAEDVVQEAYLRIFQSLHSFRAESSLSTWLTRIVINEGLARSRKSTRRAEIIDISSEMQWDEVERHQTEDEAIMDGKRVEQPEEAAERSQIRRLIEEKIDGLPDVFRIVFMLRGLEEMSVEETAACLNIPEATVRTRYFRARSMLREALSREIDHGLDAAFSFDGARCDRIVANVLARLAAH
ncbi:RNA polymerase sigma factor [Pseudoduganella sp. FT93W]|uniref:RNA polymerase sigma factor n=1 Tax=Duganella fentianensis TaxID=2692177 RepID=A0A845I2E3_9BURK|nr:RNA polymerase sigma factor [Duganella fentianensis]MYN47744.1 RNA polymerase sigma factor [Duganella fentianensis]